MVLQEIMIMTGIIMRNRDSKMATVLFGKKDTGKAGNTLGEGKYVEAILAPGDLYSSLFEDLEANEASLLWKH